MSGLIAAAAGSMLALELGTADPNAGNTALLNAIAAAVIGGASLRGGRGTALGTLIGSLTLATLTVATSSAVSAPTSRTLSSVLCWSAPWRLIARSWSPCGPPGTAGPTGHAVSRRPRRGRPSPSIGSREGSGMSETTKTLVVKHHVRVLGIALSLLGLLVTAACGGNAGSGGSGSKTVVALLPETTDNTFSATFVSRLQALAAQQQIELKIFNAKYDAATQASQATTALAQKPAAMMLWPANPAGARTILLQAKQAGVPVQIENSALLESDAPTDLYKSYVGPDNVRVGELQADMTNKALGGQGRERQYGIIKAIDHSRQVRRISLQRPPQRGVRHSADKPIGTVQKGASDGISPGFGPAAVMSIRSRSHARAPP